MSGEAGSPEDGLVGQQFLVRGRVQGVGFRYFVVEKARELTLTGFTRNLPDGRVEVQAAGSASTLEELGQALQRGPALSRVEDVERQDLDPVPTWTEFRISD